MKMTDGFTGTTGFRVKDTYYRKWIYGLGRNIQAAAAAASKRK